MELISTWDSPNSWGAAALFAAAVCLTTAGLTGIVLRWLARQAILDAPTDRSNHTTPTPRGGGIAIVVAIALGWSALIAVSQTGPTAAPPLPILAAAAGLAGLSWVDDLKGLPAAYRLPAHLIACGLGIWALHGEGLVFQGLLPDWLDAVLAVIVWAGFLNFYNFMDGIDGITGVETLGVAGGLVLLSAATPGVGLPGLAPLALAAAAAGFLFWNWPPAKLFMGDIGSVPLGYCLGWFLLVAAVHGYWAAALILPAYYLADAGITVCRRAFRLEPVWKAHREHFYQRAVAGLAAAGMNRDAAHRRVSLRIALANVVLIGCALWSVDQPLPALATAGATVGVLLWWMARSSRAPS